MNFINGNLEFQLLTENLLMMNSWVKLVGYNYW